MTRDRRDKSRIRALAVLLVLAPMGVGHAAIPGPNGEITACYNTSANPSGSLRVIDAQAGARCNRNEKTLVFSQTGPQGAKGDKGDKGDPGVNGVNGTNGTNGAPGATGATGATGPAGISTATFAGAPVGGVVVAEEFTKVASKNLPEGSWVIIGTVNILSPFPFDGDIIRDGSCQLRSGDSFIGGATDRRVTKDGDHTRVSLSMNGGAQIPAGGGEVSLWCNYQSGGALVDQALMMMIQIGGFS